MNVFVCSNPECRVIWNADPEGHCPACKQIDGGGWSTVSTEIRALPKPPSRDLADYGYAPGGYSIRCLTCRQIVIGCDKRASRCKTCAEIKMRSALREEGEL